VIGQEHDLYRVAARQRPDRFGNLESVSVLQLQVDDHDVGPQSSHRFDRDRHRVGGAGDFHAARNGEQLAEHLRELR
jgi:hypothetical protein